MELTPIIKASLGIFTVLTSITFVISFIVYKIKSRNRIKPHERKPRIFDNNLILEVHDSPGENTLICRKFKVLNEHIDNPPADNSIEVKTKDKLHTIRKANVESGHSFKPVQNKPRNSSHNVFNIYSIYSNNKLRPMHKLKVSPATAD